MCVITHRHSGKKYTVEAKSIRRFGSLGATGNTTQKSLEGSIRNQLYDALSKASDHSRIVFIDLNLPMIGGDDRLFDEYANIVERAEDLTVNKGRPTESTYVMLTNYPHHYHLSEANIGHFAMAAGYKLADFGHGKQFASLRAMHQAKKRHIEIHEILDSLRSHYDIPATFDGGLPSEVFGGSDSRLRIGQRYFFEDLGLEATVSTATVDVNNKTVIAGTDKGHIITRTISGAEVRDYLKHPEAYFGTVTSNHARTLTTPFEFFEWMLSSYKNTPAEKLLELLNTHPELDKLKLLPQSELAEIYCEGVAYSVAQTAQRTGGSGPPAE